jgi:hypothetical protein
MSRDRVPTGRRLGGMTHGGHVVAADAGATDRAKSQESISLAGDVGLTEADLTNSTRFGYMFPDLAAAFPDAHLSITSPAEVVGALKALGAAMIEDASTDPLVGNSTIPPIYTYWGQFVDHDLTANTDRDSAVSDITRPDLVPLHPDAVSETLFNLRQPSLNLDSVYGDGPTFPGGPQTRGANLYDGIDLAVGTASETDNDGNPVPGEHIPPDVEPAPGQAPAKPFDLRRDLPRDGVTARIGDERNDENLVVAQLHVGFLRFHNETVKWVRANEPDLGDEAAIFARARQLVQWHYQWLVVHDYLRTVTLPGVVDAVLDGGNHHFRPADDAVFMPLEFSVAAFRFGHSMVRGVYDWNQNFGRPGPAGGVLPNAPLDLLFTFTGNAPQPFGGTTDVLPFNWIADWNRLVDKESALPDRFARKIDTQLAPPLHNMQNMGNDAADPPIRQLLKGLAARNLVRGYLLAVPTGQRVATAFGVAPLSEIELQQNNSKAVNDALSAGGFLQNTPLWYYILKEAEVRANGNSLGDVGSRIVCETIIGQLRADPTSYLRNGWTPDAGVRTGSGTSVITIADFLRFAGTM